MVQIKTWLKKNLPVSREFWLLVLILAVGTFLRLYHISDYMTFLGDEGRDAIIVRRLLVNFDPILVGPGTSIGNMYLGPLYYYLIAPALFLANYSPVGPSIFVALVGVATIYFVYRVGKEWFSEKAGLLAAALYAVSPTVIIYSRSSWNPNIMPFFALLSVYSIWKVWKEKQSKWLIVLGVAYAFVLQSHYLGLLLTPTFVLFWILTFRNLKLIENCLPAGKAGKLEIKNLWRHTFLGLAVFLFLMSPLVIFDARHGWNNLTAMKKFFAERQTTVSARPWNAIPKMYPIFADANTSLLAAKNVAVGKWLTLGIIIFLAYLFVFKKSYILYPPSYILFSWLFFGLLGLGLYKQQIYDHYYGFMFPAFFLLLAVLLSRLRGWLTLVISSSLLVISLIAAPIRQPPNMQMQRAMEVAAKIAHEAGGKPFNLAVVAERNYEDGYQYFLEKNGAPVVEIDAQKPETITDQLFVVCEVLAEKCDPTHSPKAEVANFGWSEVDDQWTVFGVQLYRLIHTKR